MKVDNEVQRKFLIACLDQVKLTGNHKEVLGLSKQVADLIDIIQKAPIDSSEIKSVEPVLSQEKVQKSTKIIL